MKLLSKWTRKKKFLLGLLILFLTSNIGFSVTKSPEPGTVYYTFIAISTSLMLVMVVLIIVWRGKWDVDRKEVVPYE